MSTRGVSFYGTYIAWDTNASAFKTGDVANHTIRWIKDGVSAAATNTPAEVDAANCPGLYKVLITDGEADCKAGEVGGKSSTSNVVIVPTAYTFDAALKPLTYGVFAGVSATQSTLASSASAVAGYYVGERIVILSGTGAGQERIITDYTTAKVASHSEWETNPDTSSEYVILPARTALSQQSDGTALVFSEDSVASKVSICNMALSHIGVSKRIVNIETEQSTEASTCRIFYNTALEESLREFPWSFATSFVALALVEEDPTDEWAYSYRVPSDCVTIRRVLSGVRNDTRESKVPYKVARDESGLLLYTDQENAEIEYTLFETDSTRYPADFVMAFSLKLAGYIAPALTRGDPTNVAVTAERRYIGVIKKAQATSVNEEQMDVPVDSEFVRARE